MALSTTYHLSGSNEPLLSTARTATSTSSASSPLSSRNPSTTTPASPPKPTFVPSATSGGLSTNSPHRWGRPSHQLSNQSRNSLNNGAVAGAVVGAVILVLITVGCYVLLRRRYQRQMKTKGNSEYQTQCTDVDNTVASDSKLMDSLPKEQDGYGFSILPKLPFRSKWPGSLSTSTIASSVNEPLPVYKSSQSVSRPRSLLGTSSDESGVAESQCGER